MLRCMKQVPESASTEDPAPQQSSMMSVISLLKMFDTQHTIFRKGGTILVSPVTWTSHMRSSMDE
jgi:hypothetical protein